MSQIEIARKWREALAGTQHLPYAIIERYVDRLLGDDDHAAVNAHLALCAACADEVEDLHAFAGELRVAKFTTRRKTVWLAAAGLAAAATLVLVIGLARMQRRSLPQPGAVVATALRSMAVLPLRNATASAEHEFLSVGIADALASRLEERSDLAVRPMASILPIRKETADVRAVAERLQVDGVIEGQFAAESEGVVRVTVQLTDSRTGRAVWQESIRGQRSDLLKLVDDVTERTEWRLDRTSRAAQARPAGSQARSSNPQAYEAYLKARSLYGSFRPDDFAAREASLERAIALDPAFAAAHADLALHITIGIVRSLAGAQDLDRALWHAHEAVRLDPNLSEAHLAVGRVLARRADNFREAVREIMAALRLKPTNTSALQAMLSYFAYSGDRAKMRCVGERIIAIDPLSEEARTRGYWFAKTLDSESALASAPFAFADPVSVLAGHDIRGEALLLQGRIDLAEKEAAAALKLDPDRYHGKSLMAMAAAARGNRALAESWLAKFDADARQNHFAAVRAALAYAKLGDHEAALDRIDTAIALGNHGWYLFKHHPWLASMQTEPRFQANQARIKADLDAVSRDVVAVYPFVVDETCWGDARPPGKVALSSVRAAP